MKNKLKYIIEESVNRGWNEQLHFTIWDPFIKKGVKFHLIGLGEKRLGVSNIFFNHDWAKCVFGEEEMSFIGDIQGNYKNYIGYLMKLAQLKTDKQRIDYVYKYLKEA